MWSLGLPSPSCGPFQGSCSPTPRISIKFLSSFLSSLILPLLWDMCHPPPHNPRTPEMLSPSAVSMPVWDLTPCHTVTSVRSGIQSCQLMPSDCTCLSWLLHEVEAWLPGASLQEPWAGTDLVGPRGLREGSVVWRGVWGTARDDGGVSWRRSVSLRRKTGLNLRAF